MCKCKKQHPALIELRQAAIDAAVELDWTKNEPTVKPEHSERAQRIVERVFAACEALDVTPESYIKPAPFASAA
ncbi:MAG: hypothetical protein Q7U37_03145 [Gallionella sp.]|nr:hypothetical protein [Gallionella sp.]